MSKRKKRVSATKSTQYVKCLVVLRAFTEGEENTKTKESVLVDGYFTFSSNDTEETLKRKILDVMMSVEESFGEIPPTDHRHLPPTIPNVSKTSHF
jgi:hypothetical protein